MRALATEPSHQFARRSVHHESWALILQTIYMLLGAVLESTSPLLVLVVWCAISLMFVWLAIAYPPYHRQVRASAVVTPCVIPRYSPSLGCQQRWNMLFCGLMLAVFVTNLMASGVLYFSGVAQDMSRNPSASPFCDDDVLVDKYVMASVALPAEATVCSDEPLWGGPSLDAAAGTCTAAPPSVGPTPAFVAAAAAAAAASAASSAASASANSTAVLWWNTAEPSAVLLSAWLVSYVPVVLLGMALYVACRALRRRVMGLAASAAAASAGSEVSRPADMLVRWVGSDVHDLHVEARVGEDQEEAAWRRAWQRDRREWQQLLSLTRCINSKARVCAVEGVTTTRDCNVVCTHACSTTCEQNYAAHVLLLQSRTLDTGLRMVEQGAVEALLNILRKREQKQDETQEYALRTLGNLTCMLHWGTRLV